jgi:hypothetical protein
MRGHPRRAAAAADRHDVTVSRRLIAWLVTLPLAVAGTQIAHALAYRLVTSSQSERAHELSATGHGYLVYLPLALAIGAVIVAFALAAEARQLVVTSDDSGLRTRAWHFAVVAPAVFSCQEHFERLLHDGVFPWDAVLAASFVTGLLLQLPFAFAAYALARLLLNAARSLGRLLARPRLRWVRAAATKRPTIAFAAPRFPALALGYGSRGPPPSSR